MANGSTVEHGYPHLGTVRAAITALHRHLPPGALHAFATSVTPLDVAFDDAEDLLPGAQRVARDMVHHYGLPEARLVIAFRAMDRAATVELGDGPVYSVELNDRFRRHRRDIGAALAHEVAHVYLHRLGLVLPDTAENEVLVDTAAAYLGAGWLLLDAYRVDGVSSQKLGYLTPEEYGYVLAKRALLFGEDPSPWFTSPQAYPAYLRGAARARHDRRQPPLVGAGWAARRRYAADRRRAGSGRAVPSPDDAYRFEGPPPLRVTFACPTCHQRLRVPVRGRVRARCGLCRTVLECDT
ncbi:hypothetical protein [Streptomyces sp. NPDC049906]|uniref:hypothetical protein n=1 Tax=Streptomyces sp. NPDC049906 TaxID=3155656 RepID=UPI003418554C